MEDIFFHFQKVEAKAADYSLKGKSFSSDCYWIATIGDFSYIANWMTCSSTSNSNGAIATNMNDIKN